ncbi:hypothetical protein TUM17387_00710 [Shewanella carassii]|uniref:glycosyltransferase family 2 protein n=1 Tax=Shewanella carassii TaxID=1987584 RepID=UPI001BEEEDE5|nr:glycosyltransferase family 2 protein [Shewanella carassii]BCV64712.1 hypothetical protein TUM17387_00710 [Shewanella carassii]
MNQQQQPLISVIVPCFNVEEYLKECLESILKQSFEDIEIICIDDFSTDSTPKILADYNTQNRRMSAIRHTANQGLGAARNTGVNHAKGKYLFFIDSDDLLTYDALEDLYNVAEATQADITTGQIRAFDENGLHSFTPSFNGIKGKYTYTEFRKYILGKVYVSAGGRLYRRAFFDEEIQAFPTHCWYEDVVPFFKGQLSAKSLAVSSNVSLLWRQRTGSISKQRVKTDDIKSYLRAVYTLLAEHTLLNSRDDFLLFIGNSFAWYPNTPELRRAHREILAEFGYQDADFLRVASIKKLRRIMEQPVSFWDRVRAKLNA